MELIDRQRLRDSLMHEQAKYIMSDHMQSKHISAGFLLAIAELDSQPNVESVSIDWILKTIATANAEGHYRYADYLTAMLEDWRKEQKNG